MTEQEEFFQTITTLSLTLAFHPKSVFFLKGTVNTIFYKLQYQSNRDKFNRLRSSYGSVRMFKQMVQETGDPLLIRNAENYG